MSLQPALVDGQGGPITGNGGGPMPLAKPAASWSHVAGKRQQIMTPSFSMVASGDSIETGVGSRAPVGCLLLAPPAAAGLAEQRRIRNQMPPVQRDDRPSFVAP